MPPGLLFCLAWIRNRISFTNQWNRKNRSWRSPHWTDASSASSIATASVAASARLFDYCSGQARHASIITGADAWTDAWWTIHAVWLANRRGSLWTGRVDRCTLLLPSSRRTRKHSAWTRSGSAVTTSQIHLFRLSLSWTRAHIFNLWSVSLNPPFNPR